MTAIDRPIELLALVGRLRRTSYSATVLRAVTTTAPANVCIEAATLENMPFYNADLDGTPPPAAVETFRQQIARCDGSLVISPEYNHGLPAVLKERD